MFEVLWTDPNRELMGERIVRKELEAQHKDKDKDKKKVENARRSISTTSTSSSEKGFGFFSNKGRKRSAALARSRLSTESTALPSPCALTDRRTSSYGVTAVLSHGDDSEATVKPTSNDTGPGQNHEVTDCSSTFSLQDSVLSKCTEPSQATSTTVSGASVRDSASNKSEQLMQSLGPSSFVTKSTEISVSPRQPEITIEQMLSEVHISADRSKAETPPLPEVPEEEVPQAFENSEPLFLSPQTPPQECRTAASLLTSAWNGDDPLGNPDAWKPPHDWGCTAARETTLSPVEERAQTTPTPGGPDCMSPDSSALQREVRMMAAACPELILANLCATVDDSSDAMVYKELEMSKKRWMFSALHQAEGYANLSSTVKACEGPATPRPPRVLAIYETQASASFLAALFPRIAIAHLSPNPLYPNLYPNVQPILVPAVSSTAASRPLPPQLYAAVTCLAMPALFPSSEIPPLLRHVHRCLAPGGALHLTLIDPQPVAASLGPKLRQWLFDKVLVNLEQTFRTTCPSTTFPAWLALSRLRGRGSTIVTASVPAVPAGLEKIEGGGGAAPPPAARTELRCALLRMLWQEVWGTFVHAERWWWDEPDIVDECVELGTYWQYSHIVAVKEKK